jgi:hypothetical protein
MSNHSTTSRSGGRTPESCPECGERFEGDAWQAARSEGEVTRYVCPAEGCDATVTCGP